MATLQQYSSTYRFFIIEDIDLNALEQGNYFNNESASNTQLVGVGGPTTAGGSLLPGNLVAVDQASANLANPNVSRLVAATATTVPTNLDLGIVYESAVFKYAPLDNSIPRGSMVSVVMGQFIALLDANSFVAGQLPTGINQPIYAGVGAGNAGLFSTTLSGTPTTADLRLGFVKGFEVLTAYGGPGVQQGATYVSASSATPVLIGGVTVVRVAFALPYIPKV